MRQRHVSSYSSNGKACPQIQLRGNWLREHGYAPGTTFDVTPDDGVLLISQSSSAPLKATYAARAQLIESDYDIELPDYFVELLLTRPQSTQRPAINGPGDIARLLAPLQTRDREVFYTVHLDARNHVSGIEQVSVGTLSSSLVHPREVYKGALLSNASRIIVAHNHPSGNLKPSAEDLTVTKRLSGAGELLGVPLMDHIIIGGGSFRSILEDSK